MPTGPVNSKSRSVTLRVPHDVIDLVEEVKYEWETSSKFILVAIRAEATKRLRAKQKEQRDIESKN
ncbi:YlcI/YnfO family protein [Pectobacterium versatile]|uniref:YlcI/YnfO family protein n=1 Tax=Pectobacterium versatile TaxID=2488639 RepID=UPI003863F159